MIYNGHIKCEIEDQIAIVTIDNAPVNALCVPVMDGIKACADALALDDSIRAVIFTGAGKSFIAGADIKEFTGWDAETGKQMTLKGHGIFNQIENLPMPTIAAINGFALGGGLEFALACDIRIASEKAKLGLPEASLGIVPGYGGVARLAKTINIAQAKQMMFTAAHVNAQKALQIGLVQEVTTPENLMETALALAAQMSGNGPKAIREIKKAVNSGRDADISSSLALEAEAVFACFGSEDKIEGVDAFINKRSPVFLGK